MSIKPMLTAKERQMLLRGRGGETPPPEIRYYAYEIVDRWRNGYLTGGDVKLLAYLAVGFTPEEARKIGHFTSNAFSQRLARIAYRISRGITVQEHYRGNPYVQMRKNVVEHFIAKRGAGDSIETDGDTDCERDTGTGDSDRTGDSDTDTGSGDE